MYHNIFGLSCVENQVLAILRQRGEEIAYTYYNCSIPFKELYTYIVLNDVKPEYFYLIERVQELLKNLGIIELFKKTTTKFDEVQQAIYKCKENEYILIRVTPQFTQAILLARGFRNDHFIYVRMCGKNFEVFNDIPERRLILTLLQLKESFNGEYFHLIVKRTLNKKDKDYLWNNRNFKLEEQDLPIIPSDNFHAIENLGIKLRNLTGVYKLLRYRMIDYYGQYSNTTMLQEFMPQIEKIYALLEYYNLKSNTAVDKYAELFCKLQNLDTAIILNLRKEMRIKNNGRKNEGNN